MKFGILYDNFYHVGQFQSTSKTTGYLTKVFRIFCPNLMMLAWADEE